MVQGLPLQASLGIVLMGIQRPDGTYRWTGRLRGNAYIPLLGRNATVTFVVDDDLGLTRFELDFTQDTNIGSLVLQVLYSYHPPTSSAPVVGSSCKVGETQTVSGSGKLNLKLEDGSTTALCIFLFFALIR